MVIICNFLEDFCLWGFRRLKKQWSMVQALSRVSRGLWYFANGEREEILLRLSKALLPVPNCILIFLNLERIFDCSNSNSLFYSNNLSLSTEYLILVSMIFLSLLV